MAPGRSRGGLTAKIHMLGEAPGRPVRVIVTSSQKGDVTGAPARVEGFARGGRAPSNRTRHVFIPHDATAKKVPQPR